MATARLRKTFKYPDENEESEALDEQEQEKLIAELREKNEDQNFVYIRLFVGITATLATFFIPIFYRTKLQKPKYLAILGITSLALTIYMLVLVPTRGRTVPAKGRQPASEEALQLSPMQRFAPILNATLAGTVAYAGLEFRDSPRVHDGYWMICCIPLVMYSVIQLVRRFLVEVDLESLEDMRYEYKGA